MTQPDLPVRVADLVADFAAVPTQDRLQLLLEFSRQLPALPSRYGEHPEALEQVVECQSPLFVTAEWDNQQSFGQDSTPVRLFFSAPAEAPTTRGFAAILHSGLDGLSASEIQDLPADLPERFALTELVSPLRMRGMSAMLERIRRQVSSLPREKDTTTDMPQIVRTEHQWKQHLTPEEFWVLRQGGTERPFTGEYWDSHDEGVYACRGCGHELFRSEAKFDSHCGWPSFYEPLAAEKVRYIEDRSLGMERLEVRCAACDSHLGHVFEGEGYPTPTDQRYCINSLSMRLIPKDT